MTLIENKILIVKHIYKVISDYVVKPEILSQLVEYPAEVMAVGNIENNFHLQRNMQ